MMQTSLTPRPTGRIKNTRDKTIYQAVKYDNTLYTKGDCVELFAGEGSRNWIGIIEKIYEDRDNDVYILIRWFYCWGDVECSQPAGIRCSSREYLYSFHTDPNECVSLVRKLEITYISSKETPPSEGFFCRYIYDHVESKIIPLEGYIDDHFRDEPKKINDIKQLRSIQGIQEAPRKKRAVVVRKVQKKDKNSQIHTIKKKGTRRIYLSDSEDSSSSSSSNLSSDEEEEEENPGSLSNFLLGKRKLSKNNHSRENNSILIEKQTKKTNLIPTIKSKTLNSNVHKITNPLDVKKQSLLPKRSEPRRMNIIQRNSIPQQPPKRKKSVKSYADRDFDDFNSLRYSSPDEFDPLPPPLPSSIKSTSNYTTNNSKNSNSIQKSNSSSSYTSKKEKFASVPFLGITAHQKSHLERVAREMVQEVFAGSDKSWSNVEDDVKELLAKRLMQSTGCPRKDVFTALRKSVNAQFRKFAKAEIQSDLWQKKLDLEEPPLLKKQNKTSSSSNNKVPSLFSDVLNDISSNYSNNYQSTSFHSNTATPPPPSISSTNNSIISNADLDFLSMDLDFSTADFTSSNLLGSSNLWETIDDFNNNNSNSNDSITPISCNNNVNNNSTWDNNDYLFSSGDNNNINVNATIHRADPRIDNLSVFGQPFSDCLPPIDPPVPNNAPTLNDIQKIASDLQLILQQNSPKDPRGSRPNQNQSSNTTQKPSNLTPNSNVTTEQQSNDKEAENAYKSRRYRPDNNSNSNSNSNNNSNRNNNYRNQSPSSNTNGNRQNEQRARGGGAGGGGGGGGSYSRKQKHNREQYRYRNRHLKDRYNEPQLPSITPPTTPSSSSSSRNKQQGDHIEITNVNFDVSDKIKTKYESNRNNYNNSNSIYNEIDCFTELERFINYLIKSGSTLPRLSQLEANLLNYKKCKSFSNLIDFLLKAEFYGYCFINGDINQSSHCIICLHDYLPNPKISTISSDQTFIMMHELVISKNLIKKLKNIENSVRFWVRVAISKDKTSGINLYALAQIQDAFTDNSNNIFLMLRLPNVVKNETFSVDCVSDKRFLQQEFQLWKKNIATDGSFIPLRELTRIQSKDKKLLT